MSNNKVFLKFSDTNNHKFVLLDNGLLFEDGKTGTVMIPRRLAKELNKLFNTYYPLFKQEHNYLKGYDGLFTFKFVDIKAKNNDYITIKTQHSFEIEPPIYSLLIYALKLNT